ncbi:MAG: hypothetical protein J1E97_04765 [Muribaculaceae bacterium]|nr:hypothetical protein [Muribaculaceae bacterium]
MNKKATLYSFLAALFLAVVAFLFFAPADYEGKVLSQADTLQGLANSHELKEYEEATGETAYWTNSLFSGMPSFQITPSYSSNKMLKWVFDLYTLWLPSPANLVFAMMLGFFIMCLCMKMKWPGSLFGAVAWGLSTYFIIIIGAGHIWKFLTLAYIPPMIGGIALCYRGRYWGGAALTSLFTALQLGSNHPQMTYYFLFVVAALVIAWLVTDIREKKMKRWYIATGTIILAGALGVAANTASLYLSYEYSKETIRGRQTELSLSPEAAASQNGLDYDYITQWSYGIDETMTLLIPNVKGGASVKPVGDGMAPKSMLDTETVQNATLTPQEQQFIAYNFMQYFGDQPMTNGPVYVGALVLVLAVLAMFICEGPTMTPMKWALFTVSILAILLSWGSNFEWLTTFFINNVPFYNKFRTPSSMLVVVEFCVPLLATMCIIQLARIPEFMKRNGILFYLVFGFFLFVCLLGWLAPGTFGDPWSSRELAFIKDNNLFTNSAYTNALLAVEKARLNDVSSDSLRSFIFILMGAVTCLLFLKGAIKSRTVFGLALTGIVLLDLFTVNKRYVDYENFTSPETITAFTPTQADVKIMMDPTPNFRVLDIDDFTQARSSYFHKTIGGYHAAKLTRYNDLIDRQITQGNEQVINMLNARYLLSDGQAILNPEAFGNAWLVDKVVYVDNPIEEMTALDNLPLRSQAVADEKFKGTLGSSQAVSPGDTIYETSYAPGKLDYFVKSAKGGVAVFSEVFFPWGWTATIDGQPIEIGRVNYVLRALNIPAGEHTIHFEFRPDRLKRANTIGVIAVALIYLLCAMGIGVFCYKAWKYNKEGKDSGKDSGFLLGDDDNFFDELI